MSSRNKLSEQKILEVSSRQSRLFQWDFSQLGSSRSVNDRSQLCGNRIMIQNNEYLVKNTHYNNSVASSCLLLIRLILFCKTQLLRTLCFIQMFCVRIIHLFNNLCFMNNTQIVGDKQIV